MPRLRFLTMALLLTTATTGAFACRSANSFDADEGFNDRNRVGLIVKNENVSSVDVYIVSDGLATKLGEAKGLASRAFALDRSLFDRSDVRIVATPFGGNGRASTGPILAHAGNLIEFTVRSTLSASTVNIR